jgi:hypothetical protein
MARTTDGRTSRFCATRAGHGNIHSDCAFGVFGGSNLFIRPTTTTFMQQPGKKGIIGASF